jgi:hypothetical protein
MLSTVSSPINVKASRGAGPLLVQTSLYPGLLTSPSVPDMAGCRADMLVTEGGLTGPGPFSTNPVFDAPALTRILALEVLSLMHCN